MQRTVRDGAWLLGLICLITPATRAIGQSVPAERELIDRYCVTCHSDRLETGGLSLQSVDPAHVDEHAEIWAVSYTHLTLPTKA